MTPESAAAGSVGASYKEPGTYIGLECQLCGRRFKTVSAALEHIPTCGRRQ